jgi:hypothetical protein
MQAYIDALPQDHLESFEADVLAGIKSCADMIEQYVEAKGRRSEWHAAIARDCDAIDAEHRAKLKLERTIAASRRMKDTYQSRLAALNDFIDNT